MSQQRCHHQHIEWNYKGRFALCTVCRETFADVTYLRVRAGMGRVKWIVRRTHSASGEARVG